jgi:hypothetical protein
MLRVLSEDMQSFAHPKLSIPALLPFCPAIRIRTHRYEAQVANVYDWQTRKWQPLLRDPAMGLQSTWGHQAETVAGDSACLASLQ